MTGLAADRLLTALAELCANKDIPEASPSSDNQMWDNELARRVYRDPDCFLVLYEKYYDRIFSYLYRRTMEADEAHDLASRCFLQAFESLRKREQRVAFRPWLYRIATNLHTSRIRRLCRWAERVGQVARLRATMVVQTPRTDCELREDQAQIRVALGKLPDVYRTALLLRYDEELPYDEIGAILGLSAPGARTRVNRGLSLLEQELSFDTAPALGTQRDKTSKTAYQSKGHKVKTRGRADK